MNDITLQKFLPSMHQSQMQLTGKLVVIGSSTGGPQALMDIFAALPSDLSIPIVVAQHMLPKFIPPFINSINKISKLPAIAGQQGVKIEAGNIYIAPSDSNMKILEMPGGEKRLTIEATSALLKPSVDVLMQSAAVTYKEGCLGIILTGMGNDGLEGMRAIKANGGMTVIQDKSSSVVYGMPQAVYDQNLADKVLPLSSIASAITAWSS